MVINIKQVMKLKEKLGEIGLGKDIVNQLSYKINFNKELETIEKNLLTQLIRDNEITEIVRRRNLISHKKKVRAEKSFSARVMKLKKVEEGRGRGGRREGFSQSNTPCSNCSGKLLPLSYRIYGVKATIKRLKNKFYCPKCEKLFIIISRQNGEEE